MAETGPETMYDYYINGPITSKDPELKPLDEDPIFADLPKEGQVLAVTRAAVERIYNTIDREYQPRFVLSFHGVETRAVLNKTQTFDVADILNEEDYSKWIGHQLKLVPGLARNRKPTIIFKPAPAAKAQNVTQKQAGVKRAPGKAVPNSTNNAVVADLDPALLDAAMKGINQNQL